MEPIKEEKQCYDQMLIMEKYEKVISYVYPIAQSIPRKHGVAKELFLKCLLKQPDLFFQAGKSNQVSKIFSADAGIANLRFWLRFLVMIRCMSPHQHQTIQLMLKEIGAILGCWIKNKKG